MAQARKDVNYLELINELTRELSRPGITSDSLCQFLLVRTLSFLDPISVYSNKLHTDGMVRTISSCGMDQEALDSWGELPFSESVPGHDAMRADKMVWLADADDWNANYPDLVKYYQHEKLKTYIAVPIDIPGAAVAGMGIMCASVLRQDKEVTSFLWTVGGLVSLFLSNLQPASDKDEFLSPRQLEILEYIRDEYTNPEIAKEMGFSESTIRHETMRIYQIMQVSGRKEAVNLAIKQNLIKNPGARTA